MSNFHGPKDGLFLQIKHEVFMTTESAKDMDFETAQAQIENAVYEATRFLEELEHAGKIQGNGHHARQKVAEFAAEELKSRWTAT